MRHLFVLLPLFVLVGCATADALMYVEDPAAAPMKLAAAPQLVSEASTKAASVEVEPDDPAPAEKGASASRDIIYTAAVKLEVDNIDQQKQRVVAEAEALGGYLHGATTRKVTLRVPRAKFHALLATIKGLGVVKKERVNAQDVTTAMTDLRVRIENADAARKRLLRLLDKEKPLREVLVLENELRRITGELETMKSQLTNWEKAAALSTITVRFVTPPPPPEKPVEKPVAHVVEKRSPFLFVRELNPGRLLTGAVEVSPLDSPFGPDVQLPESFFIVDKSPFSMSALTADDARVFVRDVRVKGGDLGFWADAVEEELVQNRGFALVDKSEVVGADGKAGRQLHVRTPGPRKPIEFGVTVYIEEGLLGRWVRVVQVAARPKAKARLDEVSRALAGSKAGSSQARLKPAGHHPDGSVAIHK